MGLGRGKGRRLSTKQDEASRKPAVGRGGARDRVVAALGRLLGDGEDFATLSVERILTDATVARSTFYVYFTDKFEVLVPLGEEAADRLIESVADWPLIDARSTKVDLAAVMRKVVTTYCADAHIFRAVREAVPADPRMRKELRRIMATGRHIVAAHANEQQAKGGVRADIEVDVTVDWLIAMLENGLYRNAIRATTPEALEQHVRAMTDILWAVLYEGAPAR